MLPISILHKNKQKRYVKDRIKRYYGYCMSAKCLFLITKLKNKCLIYKLKKI
jgi:hypothetical protein